jgi:hypothetical protein
LKTSSGAERLLFQFFRKGVKNMTSENRGIGTNELISRAEEQRPLPHTSETHRVPRASGPVILGNGNGDCCMTEAEKRKAESEARIATFGKRG